MTKDASVRARIENDLDQTFLVEAAAGTGKTTALVGRIARLIATGRAEITQIAAITFTERASGELVLRLREKLELAREACADAGERGRLEVALSDFEAAYVGTIHGFCAELLRARPLDAGVDPAFVMLADDEQTALLEETSDRFLEEALKSPPEGVRRALARPRDFEPLPPRALFAREIRELAEHRDQDPGLVRAPFDREQEIEKLLADLAALAAMRPEGELRGDKLATLLGELGHWLAIVAEREKTRPRDYDLLEHELVRMPTLKWLDWTGSGRTKQLGLRLRANVLAARDRWLEAVASFRERADADLAFCLARDLAPALARYEARKRSLGVLDHLDALLCARGLLRTSERARVALQERFRFLFVDEVQDVDPVQKDIVLLLASDDPSASDPAHVRPRRGALYLVGDPKQAIYGFRRADLRTYLALRDALVPAHGEILELGASFRPRPAIAALVNRAFEGVFDGKDGQAAYVALEPQRPPMPDFPSVIALPAPNATGYRGDITRGAIKSSLPDAIASFVRWLIDESGLCVEDPSTRTMVPIAPRHVGILFKQLKEHGLKQARALERHGVAHAFVAPEAFFEREVVVGASALLAAIEWPEDGLSVYATLRGPFLGISDADLLGYQASVGPLSPLARTNPSGLAPEHVVVHTALTLLGELHRQRHVRAIEATIGEFFERCEADVLLLLTERRGEARALDQLRQLARRADVRGMPLRELARWLTARIDDPEMGGVEIAPDPEQEDTVALLTVHRAKGLEFPVVILADPTTRPLRQSGASRYADPSRHALVRELAGFAPIELRQHVQAANTLERAEAVRLLYVAATRARDVLVVPTVGLGEIEDSWMAPIARALVPADPRGEVRVHTTLPNFGDATMLDHNAAGPGVRPGHHAAHLEGHGVTYWDPVHLSRPIPARDPRGHTHLVERVPGASTAEAELARESERTRVIRDAELGSLETTSAARLARTPSGAMLAHVEIVDVDLGPAGAEGARFARLLDQLARERDVDLTLAGAGHARALGATDEERAAAIATIGRLRSHPTLAGFFASPDARANVPYMLATDAGPVAWGRAALVASAGPDLVVVGLAVGPEVDVPRVELSVAASALARARNRPVRAYLARAH